MRDGATEEVCDAIVTSINPSTKSARHYIKTHGLTLTAQGYQGPIHGRRQASAMWRASGRVIELTLLEKRSLPIEKLLKKVAANTAAAFI